MDISTATPKGQIVIPAELRRKYKIEAGTKVSIADGDGCIVRPPVGAGACGRLLRCVEAIRGALDGPGVAPRAGAREPTVVRRSPGGGDWRWSKSC